MNAELLLKEFHRLSEAPEAVASLRQFVLDLAIRGKLVRQDEADEPADELLRCIEAQKSKVNGKAVLHQHSASLTSIHFDIPASWSWATLEAIGLINPKNEADDSLPASFVPMPMIFSEYGKSNKHEVRQWKEIKKGFTHFAEGDVGLAKITPCFENAKSTVFRFLTGGLGAGTTELHVIRPIKVVSQYILIFLKSSHFIQSGIPKMTGTAGQKRVPRDYFAHAAFPLPPLPEQHRIVARVDELMRLCDGLESAQAKREALQRKFLEATLNQALSCKSAAGV